MDELKKVALKRYVISISKFRKNEPFKVEAFDIFILQMKTIISKSNLYEVGYIVTKLDDIDLQQYDNISVAKLLASTTIESITIMSPFDYQKLKKISRNSINRITTTSNEKESSNNSEMNSITLTSQCVLPTILTNNSSNSTSSTVLSCNISNSIVETPLRNSNSIGTPLTNFTMDSSLRNSTIIGSTVVSSPARNFTASHNISPGRVNFSFMTNNEVESGISQLNNLQQDGLRRNGIIITKAN